MPFQELTHAPTAVMGSVCTLLYNALELDSGRYVQAHSSTSFRPHTHHLCPLLSIQTRTTCICLHPTHTGAYHVQAGSSATILYVTRLALRVGLYARFALSLEATQVRGLEITDAVRRELAETSEKLRATLEGTALPVLQGWYGRLRRERNQVMIPLPRPRASMHACTHARMHASQCNARRVPMRRRIDAQCQCATRPTRASWRRTSPSSRAAWWSGAATCRSSARRTARRRRRRRRTSWSACPPSSEERTRTRGRAATRRPTDEAVATTPAKETETAGCRSGSCSRCCRRGSSSTSAYAFSTPAPAF